MKTIPTNNAFPVSSFRAKARNLFRSRSSRRCEDSGIFVSQPSPQGEGAPKGRIGQKRYERERGRSSQAGDLDERGSVSSRRFTAVPYPPLARSPFPDGEGKEEAASPQVKEANPAALRSAATSKGTGSRGYSLLPLEGGGIAHSPYRHFERKREIFFVCGQIEDVRIAVSSTQSLPLEGKVPRRGG